MATSSIFASFDIKDKKTAENFVRAMEESEKNPSPIIKVESEITDLNQIRELWAKRK